MYFLTLVFALALDGLGVGVGVDGAYPCSLRWREQSLLDPIPDDAVPTHGDSHFVIRAVSRTFFGQFVKCAGRVRNDTGFSYQDARIIPMLYKKVDQASFFEVLTNPNDCLIEWTHTEEGGTIPEEKRILAVDYENGLGWKVVRIPKNNIQIPGGMKGEWVYSANLDNEWNEDPAMVAQVMLSSINLRLEMSNFEFEAVVENGDADVFGMDVIVNESDVEVNQTVVHRKMIKQKYSFEESTSFSQVSAWSISLEIPIKAVTLSAKFEKSDTTQNSGAKGTSHEEQKEVISQRTVVVPPHTSVEACSFSSFNDGAVLPFTATGRYRVKGLPAINVHAILEEQEIPNIQGIEGDAVVAKVQSTMHVSVPTKTSFFVTDLGDPNGCRQTIKRLSEKRRQRMFNNR